MTWVRLDDGFPWHPKLVAAGPLGRDLFVAALCHSNRYLTDGRVTLDELNALVRYDGLLAENGHTLPGIPEPVRIDDVLDRLIGAGLLTFQDGHFVIHDYADYQPMRVTVENDRAAARERMRKRRGDAGLSSFKPGMFARTSGRGSKENTLNTDVHARARAVCPDCGVGAGLHSIGCGQVGAPA